MPRVRGTTYVVNDLAGGGVVLRQDSLIEPVVLVAICRQEKERGAAAAY
jgi:hypothetical protein